MMRSEFDLYCNTKISDADYELVEFVYNYHPCNFDKASIAKLVEEFGMSIIYDMRTRAQAAMEQEIKIERLREELKRAQEALDAALKEDMMSKEFVQHYLE